MIVNFEFDFIELLPDIFCYIMPGFIFVAVLRYVMWGSFKQESQHTMLNSVVISFVLKSIYDLIVRNYFEGNMTLYTTLLFLSTVIFGYFTGLLVRSKCFESVCNFLHIYRTPNTNIWNDIFKRDAWVRVFDRDNEVSYIGQITQCEEDCKEPVIILSRYQKLAQDGNVLIDKSDDDKEHMIINMRDFKFAELVDM